jgi:hypothetical protein
VNAGVKNWILHGWMVADNVLGVGGDAWKIFESGQYRVGSRFYFAFFQG